MNGRSRRERMQRCFWNPLYDRLSGLYDAVDWLTGGLTHRLRRHALAYLPQSGSRVLEIGFGSGRLHVELAARYTLFGMDLAYGMARLTQERLIARSEAVRLCVASAYHIPWPDGWFDAVLSTFAFSAMADGGRALDEMIRVTAPGGKVVIVDAGEAEDDGRMAHWLARTWEALGDYMRDDGTMMAVRGLSVLREDYGPWHAVHITVGTRPASARRGVRSREEQADTSPTGTIMPP